MQAQKNCIANAISELNSILYKTMSLKMTTSNKKLYNISVPQFKQKFLYDKKIFLTQINDINR